MRPPASLPPAAAAAGALPAVARPRPRRSRQQRGVIAVLSAAVLTFCVILMLGVAQLTTFVYRREQVRGAAEAQAMKQAQLLLTQPQQGSVGRAAVSPQLGADNSQAQDTVDTRIENYNQTAQSKANSVQLTDWRTAPRGWARVDGGSPTFSPLYFGVGRNVAAEAYVAVQQLQWTSFAPVRMRIVLVLDYSASMRSNWENTQDYQNTSVNVVRMAAANILNGTNPALQDNLPDRYNIGMVIFGGFEDGYNGKKMPSVELTAGPQNKTSDINTLQTLIDRRAQMRALLGSTKTTDMGDSSNVAGAIGRAVRMLQDHEAGVDRADVSALGKGAIILITDGVPSYDRTDPDGKNFREADIDEREARALEDAQEAVGTQGQGASAWGRGYYTYIMMINNNMHQRNTVNAQNMKKLAGGGPSKQQSDLLFLEANTPNDLPEQLTKISPRTHCVGRFTAAQVLTNSWMRMPAQQSPHRALAPPSDITAGYWVDAGRQREYRLRQVLDPADPTMDVPNNPVTPVTRHDNDYPRSVDRASFYLNPADGSIELNSAFCLEYLRAVSPQPGGASAFRDVPAPAFRLRWGVPSTFLSQNL